MGYKNAMSVLPVDLLEAIQQHIDGEYLYIPRRSENRKRWGELKNSRRYAQERNAVIFVEHQRGVSVQELGVRYYLSPKTIYKILADMKNEC